MRHSSCIDGKSSADELQERVRRSPHPAGVSTLSTPVANSQISNAPIAAQRALKRKRADEGEGSSGADQPWLEVGGAKVPKHRRPLAVEEDDSDVSTGSAPSIDKAPTNSLSKTAWSAKHQR